MRDLHRLTNTVGLRGCDDERLLPLNRRQRHWQDFLAPERDPQLISH